MVIRYTFHFVGRWTWYAAAAFVILLATYVSVGRYYISFLGDYEQYFEEWVKANHDISLKLKGLEGDWIRLSPIMRVDSLELFSVDEEVEPVAVIHDLDITIDVLASLYSRRLQFQKIALSHISLTLEEYEEKRWRMHGIPVAEEQPETDVFLNMLLDLRRVNLDGAQTRLLPYKKPAIEINMLGIQFGNDDGFRRFKGKLYSDEKRPFANFIVEAEGDPRFMDQFTGKAWLDFNEMKLGKLALVANLFGVDITGQNITGQVWGEWQSGGLARFEGRVDLPLLDLEKLTGKEIKPLKQLHADFFLSGGVNGRWDLNFKKLNYEWYEHVWLLENLRFQQRGPEPGLLNLSIESLNLDSVSEFLIASKLLPERGHDVVKTMHPHGELKNLHIDLPLTEEQKDQFKLAAELEDVSVKPWSGAPGGESITGAIAITRAGGHVRLDTGNFSMSFPRIYHHALDYDQANGDVFWKVNESGLQVSSDNIRLVDGETVANGAFLLDRPNSDQHRDPSIFLDIGLMNAPAEQKNKYLPYFLDKALLQWLDDAILDGQINEAGFAYRGLLKSDPGQGGARSVQLYFDVADVELKYQQDWPALNNVNGLVAIDDGRTVVTADSGAVFDSQLRDTRVEVYEKGGSKKRYLAIDAGIDGPLRDALSILRESPLRNQVGPVLDDWQAEGRMTAMLDLDIPLKGLTREEAGDINVDVVLEGNSLAIPEQKLIFDSLRGTVRYSGERGLFADNLQAQWLGKPVSATIGTPREYGENFLTVSMSGKVSIEGLSGWVDQPFSSFAEGELEYAAKLQVLGQGKAHLNVDSNMIGVTFNLPAPFAKPPENEMPLAIDYAIGGEDQVMKIRFPNTANLFLMFREERLAAGFVSLGEQWPKPVLTERQLVISGYIEQVVVSEWQEVIDRYGAAQGGQAGELELDTGGLVVALLDLDIGSLYAYGKQLNQIEVNLVEGDDYTRLVLRSNDIDGSISMSKEPDIPHEAAFNFVHLDPFFNGAEEDQPAAETTPDEEETLEQVDFSELPFIRFNSAAVYVDGEDFGSWSFIMKPDDNSVLVDELIATVRGISISGVPEEDKEAAGGARLQWQRSEGLETTSFSGQLATSDLKAVWARWGYPESMESKRASLVINSTWGGSPLDIAVDDMVGSMALDVRKGQILNISKSTSGTLRVLGILNFGELIRRVTSGFGYLYKKGMSFDDITGSFDLQKGLIKTREPLRVSSPSSSFRIEGDIDLNDDALDMEMVATLPVGQNLPWIAALAGGLPVAAGAYVANKLFEKEVGKLSSAVYTVRGSLSEPEVKFKRVFDTKSRKEKKGDKEQVESSGQPDEAKSPEPS
jgi:uncharacterized protein (TIGR02099 family)